MKIHPKRTLLLGIVAAGIVMLFGGPLRATVSESDTQAEPPSEVDADDEGEEVVEPVDYRAPGVPFYQYGSAARQLVEQEDAMTGPRAQWVFTRAFAWAAYEYAYNRPNYERWVAQVSDARLVGTMRGRVEQYVAAARPPVANPMPAAAHALASWNDYRQARLVADQ